MSNQFQSDSIASIAEALALAHSKIENVTQNREVKVQMKNKRDPDKPGGTYTFQYATMANILHHIRGSLTENGIWYSQRVDQGVMVTRMYHSSGEWMDMGHVPMPNITGSPQDIGSIISYFRRYSLSAAMGLATEEDNDGEQGDRDVSFHARGAPRQQAEQPQEERLPEPPQGWGDWARGLISVVSSAVDEAELDKVRDANKQFINGARRVDNVMYNDIAKAFSDKRSVLNDKVPF